MALITIKSNKKQELELKRKEELLVSDEAQNRLAEILSDAPSLETLNGTEWEMRPLRNGTKYLIVQKLCEINKIENATYGDILKLMLSQIPATCEILTLALLNDKYLIYKDGDANLGKSDVFKRTYETVLWDAEEHELTKIIFDVITKVDVSFFMEALDMLQIFRASVTEKKRTRKIIKA